MVSGTECMCVGLVTMLVQCRLHFDVQYISRFLLSSVHFMHGLCLNGLLPHNSGSDCTPSYSGMGMIGFGISAILFTPCKCTVQ
jgi:hypothetical protein